MNNKTDITLYSSEGTTDTGKTSFIKMAMDYQNENGRPTDYIVIDRSTRTEDEGQIARFDENQIKQALSKMGSSRKNVFFEVGAHVFTTLKREAQDFDGIEFEFSRMILVLKPTSKPEDVQKLIENYIDSGFPSNNIYVVFNLIKKESGSADSLAEFRSFITRMSGKGVKVIEQFIERSDLIAATKFKPISAFYYADNRTPERDAQLNDEFTALDAIENKTPEITAELLRVSEEQSYWRNGAKVKAKIVPILKSIFG